MPSCRRLVRATTCETNHGARLVVTPKPKVDQLYLCEQNSKVDQLYLLKNVSSFVSIHYY